MEPKDPIIVFKDISVHNNEIRIIRNISWLIEKGEHWALLGPNGSGKTTLLKVMSGYLWPTKGSVSILGKELSKTDIRELRKQIGWVTSYLLEKIPKTEKILDVVISGKYASFGVYKKITDMDREKALWILRFLEVDYIIDRKLRVLSQGELQKVLIARALMPDPIVMILDEPCIGLDIMARKNLLESVSRICQENRTTVVYVTHHLEEIVPEIRNVMMIKEGKEFLKSDRETVLKKENIEMMFR
ncbi:MAG: ATP-binding cassette domain-containing protein [Nanoarchaeota archaeon]|nr:ATP-binding cassette domain-containing protein [Nanoarchaeota archaeon]